MLLIWLQFFISAVIIIIAGTKLSLYADVISERTGLSKAWIGMILLGVVTSLPEVATSVASAVKINAPDLAFGNIFGSNMINLFIIPLTDVAYRKRSDSFFCFPSPYIDCFFGNIFNLHCYYWA